jgi:hypothetical protein
MVSTDGVGPKKITRSMDARSGRTSIIKIGDVEVQIISVSNRGHAGWQVTMPEGGKIEHRKNDKNCQA